MKKYEEGSRFRAKAGSADFELKTSFQAGGQEGKYTWQLLNQLAGRHGEETGPADWSAPEIPPAPLAALGGFPEQEERASDLNAPAEPREAQRQARFGAPTFFSRGFTPARAEAPARAERPVDRWSAPPAAERAPAGAGAPEASLKTLLKSIARNTGDVPPGER